MPLLLFLIFSVMMYGQAPGAPVELQGRTLFRIQTATSDLSPSENASLASARIERAAANRNIEVTDIKLEERPYGTAILAESELLVLVTDAEAKEKKTERATLAADWLGRIRGGVARARAKSTVRFWVETTAYLLLYSGLFLFAAWVLRTFQYKARSFADWYTQQHLARKGSKLLSLFSGAAIFEVLATLISVARWVLTLVLFNFYLTYAIGLFPGTEDISRTLGSYLIKPVYDLGEAIASYLPNLFFILFVTLVANYLIRFNNFVFLKIARGAIKIDGFYPDWAIPTAKLVRVLIIVLAVIIASPYLPGAQSPAFQSISIFVGVLISLGSSSTIANLISGVILTYMRAYQVGHRVQIADTIGDVTERTLLVTRLQTIRNEIVTIPNSQIMAAQILNYSLLARQGRLILHTAVTIGYDAKWKEVHQLLLAAAADTPGVEKDPPPYVWQRALNDYNVTYELNVYTSDPRAMFDIYSALHANIQDHFNKAGVEIMSPAYTALRDGNTVTIPPDQRPNGYHAPGFRIAPNP